MTPDLSVRKTEHYEGRNFICENHYTKGCHNRPMTWGLYHDQRLVGACAFACPSSERVRAMLMGKDHVDKVSELHRLFVFDQSDWQDRCDNVTSWLVTRALEGLYAHKPNLRAILTYADSTEGHTGGIYKACNAYPLGTSGAKATFYRDQTGRLRHPRQCGVNISKAEAAERGWTEEKREGKYRFLFLIGNRRDKRLTRELICKHHDVKTWDELLELYNK